MKKESLNQRILSEIEHRKTLWMAQIVLIGGLSTLFISLNSFPKMILFLIGLFLEYLFLSSIHDTNIRLKNLYKELEK